VRCDSGDGFYVWMGWTFSSGGGENNTQKFDRKVKLFESTILKNLGEGDSGSLP